MSWLFKQISTNIINLLSVWLNEFIVQLKTQILLPTVWLNELIVQINVNFNSSYKLVDLNGLVDQTNVKWKSQMVSLPVWLNELIVTQTSTIYQMKLKSTYPLLNWSWLFNKCKLKYQNPLTPCLIVQINISIKISTKLSNPLTNCWIESLTLNVFQWKSQSSYSL